MNKVIDSITVSNPYPNCLLLEFEKKKDLTLTFFRVQEYYESNKEELHGEIFSVEKFIETMMDDDGNIDYFSYWDGFNIPSTVYEKWCYRKGIFNTTKREEILDKIIRKNTDPSCNYYIIGCMKGETDTINHEIAHAMYNLNPEYKAATNNLTENFKHEFSELYGNIKDSLISMGYNDSVLMDEVQAYISTSTPEELLVSLSLEYEKHRKLVDSYRDLFQIYNKTNK
jgi:hypothetical protein